MLRLHFVLKSPISINSDSIQLKFIICAIMALYLKGLTKIKKTGGVGLEPGHYDGLMAAYTIIFYALLSMNNRFYGLVIINCVPQWHSFHFEYSLLRSYQNSPMGFVNLLVKIFKIQ